MYYWNLYNKAYAEIGSLTPIPTDCGKLCGARCCEGDSDEGMILFPHEDDLIKNKGFRIEHRDMCGFPIAFAICTEPCRRIYRPLSCRIFPLAPMLFGDTLSIIPDPRGKTMCPLLAANSVTDEFKNAVFNAFTQLIQHTEIKTMLHAYSVMLQEFIDFLGY